MLTQNTDEHIRIVREWQELTARKNRFRTFDRIPTAMLVERLPMFYTVDPLPDELRGPRVEVRADAMG